MSDTGSDDEEQPQQRMQHTAGHEDDDEFEFEQNFTEKKNPLKKTLDKPFDEVHEVSDSADDSHLDVSPSTSPMGKAGAGAGGAGGAPGGMGGMGGRTNMGASFGSEEEVSHDVDASMSMASDASPPPKHSSKKGGGGGGGGKAPMVGKPGNMMAAQARASDAPQNADESSEEEEESEEDEEEDESTAAAGGAAGSGGAEGGAGKGGARLYNPADFKHLVVSSEISSLFEYIARHKPADIELDTRLKPFIPDYIPAVGDIDAFLKVPPPDPSVKLPALGLVVLDEPCAQQSDPTVLELSLRAVNKAVISSHASVGTIEQADKNPARVLKWIQSIEDVHRKKPPPHVHYSRPMPDIEQLMQVWPAEFEALLHSSAFQLPQLANLDCDVAAFARMVCAIMDIPVYDKLTESLHVLFTLYAEFQNHAYFQH